MTQSRDLPTTDAEWKEKLGLERFEILRRGGTEQPFTGVYWDEKNPGTYSCAGCGTELFRSDTKYESGTGWPSFWEPIDKDRIVEVEDRSMGIVRVEARCAVCDGHLGHVFPDGPQPTGLRYCLNSASLDLAPD
ncbi:MAG: peptide-methionine (R)-S-oxide reductase MsrB [Acidimicrobiia bacterium]|nr:peptide-methionine (R)-S-oxide reductase MsrB [Acidimicrobiia bacterium]